MQRLIRKGKHSAAGAEKARILLKADASEAGEGWSDSQIAEALDTSIDTIARTRQQLVEEGFEAALTRKHSRTPPDRASSTVRRGQADRPGLFSAAEGTQRWTLTSAGRGRGAEHRRSRQRQHDRADAKKNTLKPHLQEAMGHPAGGQRRLRSQHGGRAGGLPAAARSGSPRGLPGRDNEATDQRNARANPGKARTARAA